MFEDNGNKCGKCQNHEFEVLKKGHARDCPYKHCKCLKCRLLDARSDILQVISGKETKLKGTKKDPNCGFCQNHGVKILRKGHVRSCGFGQERHFRLDDCFDCEVHYIRNEVNRLQIKMRRAMKEDRTLSEEQRKTAREAITRDEVERVCDMARHAREKRGNLQTSGASTAAAAATSATQQVAAEQLTSVSPSLGPCGQLRHQLRRLSPSAASSGGKVAAGLQQQQRQQLGAKLALNLAAGPLGCSPHSNNHYQQNQNQNHNHHHQSSLLTSRSSAADSPQRPAGNSLLLSNTTATADEMKPVDLALASPTSFNLTRGGGSDINSLDEQHQQHEQPLGQQQYQPGVWRPWSQVAMPQMLGHTISHPIGHHLGGQLGEHLNASFRSQAELTTDQQLGGDMRQFNDLQQQPHNAMNGSLQDILFRLIVAQFAMPTTR